MLAKILQLKESYQKVEIKATAFLSLVVDDVIIGHILDSDVQFFNMLRNKYLIREIDEATKSIIFKSILDISCDINV